MAIEVAAKSFLHEVSNVSSSSSDSSTLRSSSTSYGSSTSYNLSSTYSLSTLSSSPGHDQSKQGSKPFWANYIHDLESIWWIAVWLLYRFEQVERKRKTSENVPRDHQWNSLLDFESLFDRELFFSHDNIFFSYISDIPRPVPVLEKFVTQCRKVLLSAYKAKESKSDLSSPIYMSRKCTLHKKIYRLLDSAQRKNDVDRVVPIKKRVIDTGTGSKPKCNINKTGESGNSVKEYSSK